jgi:hypothetical protein
MVNNSVLTTMLTTAGTEVETVEYCSWSNATTNSSNAQLLNSLLKTLDVDSKTNGFVEMDLQKRAQEASLSALPFLSSGLGHLASKIRKNLPPLFLW